jgi:hypothetical protein
VDWPGRVGRHELDLHPLAGAEAEPPVVGLASGDDLSENVVQPSGRQVEVDEPGPRHLDVDHVGRRVGAQDLGEPGGKLARVEPRRLGGRQRHVGRPVAVLAPCRPLERDGGRRGHAELVEGAAQ